MVGDVCMYERQWLLGGGGLLDNVCGDAVSGAHA